ncbi:MAG TPA: 2-amino-4-hydroxy-6-hydroxymethyldihydropteridine diphosphokinase [Myxococcales bacterium]
MIEAFIGLGSNLGDRLGNLGLAVDRLAREPGFSFRRVSLAYETEPIGPPQPRYLNAVAQVGTMLSPRATLQKLHGIEEVLGRVRRERWGSREIDLDLLLFGDRTANETGLVIPHPLLHARAFALVPLAEIAPLALHPGARQTAAELLAALHPEDRAQVRPFRAIRRSLAEPDEDDDGTASK